MAMMMFSNGLKEDSRDITELKTVATLKAYGTTKRPVAQRPEMLREAQTIGEKLA